MQQATDNFYYRDDTHQYFYQGREIPGVNKILTSAGLIKNDFYDQAGAARGKAVHDAIYLSHFDNLDFFSIDEAVFPYLEGWERFQSDTLFTPLLPYCERPSYHPRLKFGGTPDLVGYLNGRLVLIDLKSGSVESWAAYQTAAYKEILVSQGVQVVGRFALKLYNTGRYKLIPFFNESYDLNVFTSALNIYNAQQINKVLAA